MEINWLDVLTVFVAVMALSMTLLRTVNVL